MLRPKGLRLHGGPYPQDTANPSRRPMRQTATGVRRGKGRRAAVAVAAVQRAAKVVAVGARAAAVEGEEAGARRPTSQPAR